MLFINQLEYPHIQYRTNVKREGYTPEMMKSSIKASGCGLCCSCMAVDILTDKSLSLEDAVKLSEECGANLGPGTSMPILAPVLAQRFGLDLSTSLDPCEVVEHLRRGGVAIALVGVPEGEKIGLFSEEGHYILLVSTDGKQFCILDPYYKEDKFDIPERAGKVNFENKPFIYCDVDILHSQTHRPTVEYFLLSRAKK